jgi:hypothetical protein
MSQTKAQLVSPVGILTASGISVSGIITAVSGNFSGNVTIGGTLTYEDVTNVDSIGVVTARSGFVGNLTGTASTATYAINAGISTYATSSGISTYATTAGISTYATTAGISTVSQGLTGTPNITVGIVTASSIRSGVTTTGIGKTLANREFCSVIADGITITLPASPSAGWEVGINNTSTFTNITIARNSELLMGLTENMTFDIPYATVSLLYVSNSVGWRII